MEPTHFLIPAKDYAKLEEIIIDNFSWEPILDNTIGVDLSEESVKAKAYESAKIQLVQIRGNESIDMGYEFSHDHYEGYQQLRKDLLNIK